MFSKLELKRVLEYMKKIIILWGIFGLIWNVLHYFLGLVSILFMFRDNFSHITR